MRIKRDSKGELYFSGVVFLIGGLILVVSLTILARFSWLRVDLYLLLITVIALFDLGGAAGVLLAGSWGLLMDTFSGYFLGPHIMVYPLGFFLVRSLQAKFLFRRALEGILLTFWMALLLEGLVVFFIRFICAGEVGEGIWGRLLYQALVLALLFPPFWFFFRRLRQRFGLGEEI